MRAAAGLSLGTITYFFSKRLRSFLKNSNENIWTLLTELILLLPVIICALNLTNTIFNLLILNLFVSGFSILLALNERVLTRENWQIIKEKIGMREDFVELWIIIKGQEKDEKED